MAPSFARKRPRDPAALPDLSGRARQRLEALVPPAGGWLPDRAGRAGSPELLPGDGYDVSTAPPESTPGLDRLRDDDSPAGPGGTVALAEGTSARIPERGNPGSWIASVREAVADRLPVAIRGGGPRISAAAAAGLALIAALAIAFAAAVLWRGRVTTLPVAPPSPPGGVPSAAQAFSTAPAAAPSVQAHGGTPSSGTAGVVVDVQGRVRRPGLATLPPGSRVGDALAAAGGVARGGQTRVLNLARVLADGEQLIVPGPGESLAPAGPSGIGSTAGSAPNGSSPSPGQGGMLDLNVATVEQLDELPGVGPVLAQRIVDWRDEHGRFSSVDELQEVSGIGAAKFSDIRTRVRV